MPFCGIGRCRLYQKIIDPPLILVNESACWHVRINRTQWKAWLKQTLVYKCCQLINRTNKRDVLV